MQNNPLTINGSDTFVGTITGASATTITGGTNILTGDLGALDVTGGTFGALPPGGLDLTSLTLSSTVTNQLTIIPSGGGVVAGLMTISGAASLGGAALNVVPQGEAYLPLLGGKTFTILDASSIAAGQYGNMYLKGFANQGYYSVTYGAHSVDITFRNPVILLTSAYPATASSSNAYITAAYLDQCAMTATGDLAYVIDTLDTMLLSGNGIGVQQALNTIQNSQTNATGVSNTNNQLGVMSASRTQMFSFVSNEGAENNSAGTSSFTKGMQSIDPTRLAAFGKLVMDQRMKTGGVASLLGEHPCHT